MDEIILTKEKLSFVIMCQQAIKKYKLKSNI